MKTGVELKTTKAKVEKLTHMMLKLMPWEKETGNADDVEEKAILYESALHHREKASRRAAMATMVVTARVMGRAVGEEKAAAGKVLEKAMTEDPKEVREVEKVMVTKELASNAEKWGTKRLSADKWRQSMKKMGKSK